MSIPILVYSLYPFSRLSSSISHPRCGCSDLMADPLLHKLTSSWLRLFSLSIATLYLASLSTGRLVCVIRWSVCLQNSSDAVWLGPHSHRSSHVHSTGAGRGSPGRLPGSWGASAGHQLAVPRGAVTSISSRSRPEAGPVSGQ